MVHTVPAAQILRLADEKNRFSVAAVIANYYMDEFAGPDHFHG